MRCEECVKKDRMIQILHTQSENYRHDAELWKKHLFHVQDSINNLMDYAKNLRWYPSDYRTRGESGITMQERGWCEVQRTPVPDDMEQIDVDRLRANR